MIVLTGFPGFLGSRLVERLLDRTDHPVACLVQPKFAAAARERAAAIEAAGAGRAGRVELVEGDITQLDLGLGSDYDRLQRRATEVYHLAAVYDLGVRRALAERVNVDGTKNALDFAEGAPRLERFQYVSTCYVSGRYDGVFTEDDLGVGQRFNNAYEETKYRAEVAVQERMSEGMPATVYRPAIVVGDSRTGRTQKYDGPYYILRWLLRQPHVAVLPSVGDGTRFEVNVVPSDFVVDAIAHLSGLAASRDRVYQLADPNPLTVAEMVRVMGRATDRRVVELPLPQVVAKGALRYVPPIRALMQIEPASVDYFAHPTRYTTRNTQRDLAGSGIVCPPFASYVDTLVGFMREHPEISSAAMV